MGVEERYLLSDRQQGSATQYVLTGKTIEKVQAEAKKICAFLSLAYGFRVTELIADFVKARTDCYYLVNLKSFTLEETNYRQKVKEQLKTVESQAVVLRELRECASDSSKFLHKHSHMQVVWLQIQQNNGGQEHHGTHTAESARAPQAPRH